jgi:hypothetical protein
LPLSFVLRSNPTCIACHSFHFSFPPSAFRVTRLDFDFAAISLFALFHLSSSPLYDPVVTSQTFSTALSILSFPALDRYAPSRHCRLSSLLIALTSLVEHGSQGCAYASQERSTVSRLSCAPSCSRADPFLVLISPLPPPGRPFASLSSLSAPSLTDNALFHHSHDTSHSDVTHVLPLFVFDERFIELSGLPGYKREGPEARTRLCKFWRTGAFRARRGASFLTPFSFC